MGEVCSLLYDKRTHRSKTLTATTFLKTLKEPEGENKFKETNKANRADSSVPPPLEIFKKRSGFSVPFLENTP